MKIKIKKRDFFYFPFVLILFFLFSACSSPNDIFPPLPDSITASNFELSSPIAVVADPAHGQIVSINSNTHFLFDQGSLVTLSVDASNPAAPVLKATSQLATPNFAGNPVFDGTFIYLPFREGADGSQTTGQLIKYQIDSASVTKIAGGTTSLGPFGTDLQGGSLFVVSDDVLEIFDTSLNKTASIDLKTAENAAIPNATSVDVENGAIDTVNNRAFISNRSGKILVVDLSTNTLTHVIDGPTNTRGIAYSAGRIYAVDGALPALWVFDSSQLSTPASPPVEVDDSILLIKVVALGLDPNGILIDAANARAYVANSGDPSVSVFDLNLLQEIARISLNKDDTGLSKVLEPTNMAVGTYGGVSFVFVANFSSNSISVINAKTLRVVGEFLK